MEIKFRAPHAIDAMCVNLTHWLISTQAGGQFESTDAGRGERETEGRAAERIRLRGAADAAVDAAERATATGAGGRAEGDHGQCPGQNVSYGTVEDRRRGEGRDA